jgi:hypothetical protein
VVVPGPTHLVKSLSEPCQRCKSDAAVKLIGSVAHCHNCAEAFLAPLRAKWLKVVVVGVANQERHPPEMRLLQCTKCKASWVGYPDEQECDWCIRRAERMQEDERKALLWPEWASNGYGQWFDALDDVNKAIWRQTRGQDATPQMMMTWVQKLGDAVERGDITDVQARAAVKRVRERVNHE